MRFATNGCRSRRDEWQKRVVRSDARKFSVDVKAGRSSSEPNLHTYDLLNRIEGRNQKREAVKLLLTQRDGGIETRRTPCRQPARDQADGGKRPNTHPDRGGIPGLEAEQECAGRSRADRARSGAPAFR